jgi:hypothetical protein
MDDEKIQGQSAQPTSAVEDLVNGIKVQINDLVAEECDPIPPGCTGTLGSGTYEGLAQQIQDANSSRKKLITEIKKDFNKLATELGY